MPHIFQRLTALGVKRLKEPGLYADGGGLYLQVTPNGRSWIFRYRLAGRRRDMGLGSTRTIELAKARDMAKAARVLIFEGKDPIAVRDAGRVAAQLEATKAETFETCADGLISAKKAGWKSEKHAAQWTATLKTYVYPVFGDLPIRDIGVDLVLKVLRPIWATKPETASRLRGRMERVFGYATALKYRDGPNPAAWIGNLDSMLAARKDVQKVEHFKALPYLEMGSFMARLRALEGSGPLALQFLIYTATRTSDVRFATWSEVNFDGKVWTISRSRMKGRKSDNRPDHKIPLSEEALRILRSAQQISDGSQYIFPGGKLLMPLSENGMLAVLERMNAGVTAHGFRSSFRDWCAECTNHPREVAEMALAHSIGNDVERAYRRGDLFQKRISLMHDWAKHCLTGPDISILDASATKTG